MQRSPTTRGGARRVSGARPSSEAALRGADAIRPFEHSLPMQVLRVREALMQRFRPHLHAHGLTEQQWRVVRALAEEASLEIAEIGQRCCIHPASLSLMLPKLETAGFLARRPSAVDQRRVMVSLTAQGRRLFRAMGLESEAIYAEIEREIGADRLAALYRVLDEVLDSLSADSGRSVRSENGRRRRSAPTPP